MLCSFLGRRVGPENSMQAALKFNVSGPAVGLELLKERIRMWREWFLQGGTGHGGVEWAIFRSEERVLFETVLEGGLLKLFQSISTSWKSHSFRTLLLTSPNGIVVWWEH